MRIATPGSLLGVLIDCLVKEGSWCIVETPGYGPTSKGKLPLSSSKRAVSVLFNEEEYSELVRIAAELTLSEGRRVSIAELVRRATLSKYKDRITVGATDKSSGS